MIAYLDTSALVPLLVTEPTSPACRRLWNDADQVVSTRLLQVGSAAALVQANRLGRLPGEDMSRCLELLDRYWEQIDTIELDDTLMFRAARLAVSEGLRGYDAVHGAAAHLAADPELVAGAGDQRLLRAWKRLGVAVYDTTGPDGGTG